MLIILRAAPETKVRTKRSWIVSRVVDHQRLLRPGSGEGRVRRLADADEPGPGGQEARELGVLVRHDLGLDLTVQSKLGLQRKVNGAGQKRGRADRRKT